ncbi:HAD family hydrolase [Neptuniibacter sp. QD48_55]|uniref:HAD family hydrolase n=1 Tax=Neptuniibacter sp. QD48_55 TaxID=3398212 RepID=UPI0039F5BADE
MIRCITFDLDDTLWAVDPVIQHANQTMFAWISEHASAFLQHYKLHDLAALRQIVLEDAPEIAHSVTLIRMEQLKYGLRKAGYSADEVEALAAQAFEVFIQARQEVVFFEHAREVLSELKQQGYQLGALSNGNADIHRVGLADLIDFHFKADDVGQMKPHPLMFEQMLAHTGLRPEQVIHVGDNHEHDVEGAAAVGLWTIWVNLQSGDKSHIASAQVSCLSELPARVAEINQQAHNRITL